MAKITGYTFAVAGTGLFPFDMLRYDGCHPKTERDSAQIESTTHRGGGSRQVVVLTGPRQPTEGRWESFGWCVQGCQEVRG